MNALAHDRDDDRGPDRTRLRGLRWLVLTPFALAFVAVVWLVESLRRLGRRPAVRIPPRGVTTFVAHGLEFVLTPDKFGDLRRVGLPVHKWATSIEDLADAVFNSSRTVAILTLMCADQVPPDWPPSKFPIGVLANRDRASLALAGCVGYWYGRLESRECCPR